MLLYYGRKQTTIEWSFHLVPKKLITVFIAATLLFSACSKQKTLSPLLPSDVVLAFGDSLTVGVGAKKSESYPTVLQQITGLHVESSGVSGETTRQGLARLESVLEQTQPKLVLLLEGGNDILKNKNPQETKNNLISMVMLIRSFGAEVVLIGVPPKKIFASECADFYQEVSQELDVILNCDTIGDLLQDNNVKSDVVHFNATGYTRLAEAITQFLQQHGAI